MVRFKGALDGFSITGIWFDMGNTFSRNMRASNHASSRSISICLSMSIKKQLILLETPKTIGSLEVDQ
jgi:hypothetical protein